MSHARSSYFSQAFPPSTDTPTTSSSPPQEQLAPAATTYPLPTMIPTVWPAEAEEIICYYRKIREEGNSPLLDAKGPDDIYTDMEEEIKNRRILNRWKKRRDLDDFRKFVMDYFGIVEREEEGQGLEEEAEDEKDLEEYEDLKNEKDEEEDDEDEEEGSDFEDEDLEDDLEDEEEDDWDFVSNSEDFFFYDDLEHDDDDYITDDDDHLSDYERHIRNVILDLDLRIHVMPLPWRTLLSMAKLHASLLVEIRDTYHARQQDCFYQRQRQRQGHQGSNAEPEPGAAEIIRRASIATASNAETMCLVWEYRARLRAELQEACRAREVRQSRQREQ